MVDNKNKEIKKLAKSNPGLFLDYVILDFIIKSLSERQVKLLIESVLSMHRKD